MHYELLVERFVGNPIAIIAELDCRADTIRGVYYLLRFTNWQDREAARELLNLSGCVVRLGN